MSGPVRSPGAAIGSRLAVAILGAISLALAAAAPAAAAPTSQSERFTASDGVSLQTTISGEAPLAPRPLIVEFSPYGRNSGTVDPGPAYNFLLVQIRGTGDSDGRFDALGERTQADVAEVLQWACGQPWSDGRLGLNGFSASAITIYNSLHLPLPCVKTAVLKSGTHELYRDLIYPGGISNIVPGTGVLALIGGAALAQSPDRIGRDPLSGLDTFQGITGAGLSALQHPSLDDWWRERGMRGDVNHMPILMIDGFFDVESRGAFQAYQELRSDGAHLMVIGAHDGAPAGTDGGVAETRAWFDHYMLGADNGVELHPRVQLWMADGDREDQLAGDFVRYDGSDWPIPGTRWASLALDPAKSGSARSLNDGSLTPAAGDATMTQPYPALLSLPSASDPHNTAIALGFGGGGFSGNALADAVPLLSEMTLAEPLGLSYTTEPLIEDVLSAGPANLRLPLSSTAPETGIWAVISDVSPDGTPHPVASGRLLNSYPDVDPAKSLTDPVSGEIVQPYGVYDHKTPAAPGEERLYQVEFWPIGNRFQAGHRLRLHILGTSAASLPSAPAINSVRVGGPNPSRLLLPMLPDGAAAPAGDPGTNPLAGALAAPARRPGARKRCEKRRARAARRKCRKPAGRHR